MIGKVFEAAVWLNGTETPELLDQHRAYCRTCFNRIQDAEGVIFKPITFVEKRPGDDRVPPVPGNIQGPDVRLLVAEAEVLCRRPEIVLNSFLGDLDLLDLQRLRTITKRAAKKHGKTLTDQEADRVIESLGPQAAYEAVRAAVDRKALN